MVEGVDFWLADLNEVAGATDAFGVYR